MANTEKLCNAIKSRNDSEMRRLINEMTIKEVNARYKLDITDKNQQHERYFEGTALHFACLVNNTTAIDELLRLKGIHVNSGGFGYWYGGVILLNHVYTPLMVAAAMKHMESFELLVQVNRTTVGLKATDMADWLKDLNQENHNMLLKILAAKEKSYDNLTNRFTAVKKEVEELTVTVSNTDMIKTNDLQVLKVHENNYGKLLESGEMTDFRITCGEETFHCHRNILLAQSNVMKAMFSNDMKESREDSMTINDLNPTTVKLLLKFIYTGSIDLEDIQRNSIKLLKVADKYELYGLTKLCENELMTTIDNNNVLEIIMKADLYHADNLKHVAMDWIVKNKFEIVTQEGWKKVLFKFPGLMTDMLEAFITKPVVTVANTGTIKITEIEILKAHENNFEKLLESGEMSDFKIICGEETFNCHSNILSAQSNLLGTVLKNDIGESQQNSMIIKGLEPEIVKLLLKFIYTGNIDREEIKENSTKLLEVADRYALKELTKLCENELMPTIDNNNVLEMIMKADLYHANNLRKYAMKWIIANKVEIVKQKGWKEVLLQFPILIDMLEVLTKSS